MSATIVQEIHQAYFGAVNGVSHGQLASSMTDSTLRSFLSGFTDRPGVTPAGFTLQPYLTGTAHEDFYLISRTWPDYEVARAGMVFTHVLIIPLQSLQEIHDLSPILDLLLSAPPSIEKRSSLTPLILSTGNWSIKQAGAVPESWLAVIGKLLDTAESASVYAIGNATSFKSLLESLWQGIPTPLRSGLSWGIRFTPPGDRDLVPILINVPDELELKWRGKELIRLETNETKLPDSPIEQLLFGEEQGNMFRHFIASDLEVSPTSFEILKRCQRAYVQFQHLQADKASAGELLALVRSLKQLQPNPDKAIIIKEVAIQALANALVADGVKEALGVRNLSIEPFQTGKSTLGQAIGQVVGRVVITPDQDIPVQGDFLGYIADPDAAKIETWWYQAAQNSFLRALNINTQQVTNVVWLGLVRSQSTRDYLFKIIPDTADWARSLSQNVPVSLTTEIADSLTTFSAGRNWWDLFAGVVEATYKPQEALRRQLMAEKRLNLHESSRLNRLAKKVSDPELISLAVDVSNSQLHKLAGARCGQNPTLLISMNVRQPAWRSIWSVSLAITQSLTVGLSKPKEIIETFLAEVADGEADNKLPLELIASSSFANVLYLPERQLLWNQLPANLLPYFTSATLDALVTAILANGWNEYIDPILLDSAKTAEFNTKFLYEQRSAPAAVLAVENILHNLSDRYFKDYIANLSNLNRVVALQVGKLIAGKVWKQSATTLLERAKVDDSFRLALAECSDLFNWWERFRHPTLFGHSINSDDAWRALSEIMIELYEEGPNHEKIWKRAGGDVAKLNNAQSHTTQWVSAIDLLRHGGGGRITADSLIKTSLKDFMNNSKLQTLASLQHLFKVK